MKSFKTKLEAKEVEVSEEEGMTLKHLLRDALHNTTDKETIRQLHSLLKKLNK